MDEEKIFSAVVHVDEHNSRMHLCFVPLTRGERLSAKEVKGGRVMLIKQKETALCICVFTYSFGIKSAACDREQRIPQKEVLCHEKSAKRVLVSRNAAACPCCRSALGSTAEVEQNEFVERIVLLPTP